MKPLPILGLVLTGVLMTGSIALAESPPVTRVELLTAAVHGTANVEKILSYRIEMAPQISGQKHFHPMPVIGYVVSGEIAFQIEGKDVQILKSGDAFFEPAKAIVTRWENIGTTRAVFVANYIAASNEDELLIRLD